MTRFLFLLLGFCLTAGDAGALTVRESALIDRDKVLVGDLFDVDGDVARQPVGDAPPAGKSNTFDVYALKRVARAYNLDWSPTRLDIKTVVKRDSTPITTTQIIEVARNALMEKAASQNMNADNLDILLDRRTLEVQLPAKVESPAVRVVDLHYNSMDFRFKGMLMVEADADSQPTLIPLTGRAIPNINVPVLVRAVNEGTVLSEADFETQPMPLNKAGADIITTMSQLSGKELRRDMATGQPLRARDVRPQQLVKRGATVTMVVESGGMRVTAQARALADGGVGDTVRVMNSISNRVIEGKVLPDGNVAIPRAI